MKKNFLLSIKQKAFGGIRRNRGRRVLMFSAMAVLFTSIIALASIPGTDGVISGCYSRSGGALRVIDASVTQCKQSETSLNFNQTGPQGPQGATGPAGTSEVYFARQTGGSPQMLSDAGVILLSKNVPAGSYIINAKVEGSNEVPSPKFMSCSLNTGDISRVGLEDTFSVTKRDIVALQDAATFNAPATITLTCSGNGVFADYSVLTAVKVDTID